MNTDYIAGIIIFIIAIGYTVYINSRVVEYMTSNELDTVTSTVEGNISTVRGTDLNWSENKERYATLATSMRNQINMTIVREIANGADEISADPLSSASSKVIETVNRLREFNDTLEDGSTFISTY